MITGYELAKVYTITNAQFLFVYTNRKTMTRDRAMNTRVYPNVSGLGRNEINNNDNKHSLRSNTKGYGAKTQ